MQYRIFRYAALGVAAAAMAGAAVAGSAKQPAQQPQQDQIVVASHIAVTGSPVTRLMATEHYGHVYLYAEHAGDKSVTLIDVTKAGAPKVIAELSYPQNARDGLVAVAGTSAVVEDQNAPAGAGAPRVVKVMDFADVEHPKVAREFDGVTAISRDGQRGLIFLANRDGVWVLEQKLAEDPAMVEAYNNYVLYSH